jgi:NTP pyrophosphatase (non-canonical NTP hydrolase)
MKNYISKAIQSDLKDFDYKPIIKRLQEYESSKGLGYEDPSLMRVLHGAIGISGEAGELMDSLKKVLMYGKPLDQQHLKEECGDLLWYMAILLNEIGSDFEEVMQMNIDKLSKRYPQGFTEKDAIERKDKNEKS